MPIEINQFGGMVPKLDPSKIADNASQMAHNCNITGGVLSPLSINNPFTRMHDENTGVLNSNIPSSDVIFIPEPSAPTFASSTMTAQPGYWMQVAAWDWLIWEDDVTGQEQVFGFSDILTPIGFSYIEEGFIVRFALRQVSYTLYNQANPFFLKGPRLQVKLAADPTHINGGPAAEWILPSVATEADQIFPTTIVPLEDQYDNIYSQFQIADVNLPIYDGTHDVSDLDSKRVYGPKYGDGEIMIRVNMNYAINKRRHFYYTQTALTPFGQEGPVSELSERIVNKPGEEVTLNTPIVDGYQHNNLYRSTTGRSDDFLLVDNIDSNTYIENVPNLQAVPVPPFGNAPISADDEDGEELANFLAGSVIHPAQFGMAIQGDTLYMSDVDRFEAWPEENTIQFQEECIGLALSGNTGVVFTTNNVYGVSGSNPAAMSMFLISDTNPLLAATSLCRIGQKIFYATYDGLAVTNGRSVEILTADYFTREQWLLYKPDSMMAKVADNSIFLEVTSGLNPQSLPPGAAIYASRMFKDPDATDDAISIRIDLDETTARVTGFNTTSATAYSWKTKRFFYDEKRVFDYIQVISDDYSAVTVKIFADRVLAGTATILNNIPTLVPNLPHAKEWEFEVNGTGIIERATFYDRSVRTIESSATFNPENTPNFRDIWVRFPHKDRFNTGYLSIQDSGSSPSSGSNASLETPAVITGRTGVPKDGNVTLNFFDDAGDLIFGQVITNREVFELPRGLQNYTTWRIEVDSDKHIEELFLASKQSVASNEKLSIVKGEGIPPWFLSRYDFQGVTRELSSVSVTAPEAVKMNIYYDGSVEPSTSVIIGSTAEVEIDQGACSYYEFDFDGKDDIVSNVNVFTKEPEFIKDVFTTNSSKGLMNKSITFRDPSKFVYGRISAASYDDLVISIYSDGTKRQTISNVNDDGVFFFSRSMAKKHNWRIDIETVHPVYSAEFFEERVRPVQGKTIHEKASPGELKPWEGFSYEFSGQEEPVSIRIEGDSAVTLSLYIDGETSPSVKQTLTPGVESQLLEARDANTGLLCSNVSFKFSGDVDEVMLFMRNAIDVPLTGVRIGDGQKQWQRLRFRFPNGGKFVAGSIGASKAISGTISFYADGILEHIHTITDEKAFRLPDVFSDGSVWDVDVVLDKGNLESLILMPEVEQTTPGSFELSIGNSIPPWMYQRFQFSGNERLSSIRVISDSYPVVVSLTPRDKTKIKTVIVPDSLSEVYAYDEVDLHDLTISFGDNEQDVRQIRVNTQSESVLSREGISLGQGNKNWRGLRYKFVEASKFAVGAIGALTYPVNLTLYNEQGVQVLSQPVTDGKHFTLPRTTSDDTEWVVDVSGQPTSLVLAPRSHRPINPGQQIHFDYSGLTLPPWLLSRFAFKDKTYITGVRVQTDLTTDITMNIYADGADLPTQTIDIDEGSGWYRIDGLDGMDSLEFDFDGDDGDIQAVTIHPVSMAMVGDGIFMQSPGPWRGRLFQFPDKGSMACVSITADGFDDMRLKLYADGTEVYDERIDRRGAGGSNYEGGAFMLPRDLPEANLWEVDLDTGQNQVHSVIIKPWQRLKVPDDMKITFQEKGDIPPWMFTKWDVTDQGILKSATIHAYDYPVNMDIYRDESSSKDREPVLSASEILLSNTDRAGAINFDFYHEDYKVSEIILNKEEHIPVKNEGIVLRQAEGITSWRNKTLRFQEVGSFDVVRMVASSYNQLTLKLTANGESVTKTITSGSEVKLPITMTTARDWDLDIESPNGEVYEVWLIGRVEVPSTNGTVKLNRASEPSSWLARKILASRPVSWSAMRVIADLYPVTVTTYNEDGAEQYNIVVDSDRAVRLPQVPPQRKWSVDVVPDDDNTVITEASFATSMSRL